MVKISHNFQIFVKPIGPICNLNCNYCYYIKNKKLYTNTESFRMPEDILEKYIKQHIEAMQDREIRFSWHGGEPALLGIDYFKKIVQLQKKYKPVDKFIKNGIQTNGTLLDENWASFLAAEDFFVGISLDGPKDLHDKYRLTKDLKSSYDQTIRGYEFLKKYKVQCEILCVVNSYNVQYPLEIYNFYKEIKTPYVTFLPMVEILPESECMVSELTVSSIAWGKFLCNIFDEWISKDIGKIKIQIFEEATRTAFGQEHSLCIFRPTCGNIPVVEHNGDFFSCDHFVDIKHHIGNISKTPLLELLDNPLQKDFGNSKKERLPNYCQNCEVLSMCNGGCPKNRFIKTPDSEQGLNYLCEGYKSFFTHCKPFVTAVANQWNSQKIERTRNINPTIQTGSNSKVGRNDPCPCGSGKKYKICCMRK